MFLPEQNIELSVAIAVVIRCKKAVANKKSKSAWLLIPSAASLALFAYLLTLHPTAAGRVYAAYGGVYIAVALMWLWLIDGIRPTTPDFVGVLFCLVGMAVIMFGPRN